jgi:hypothetical protein
MGSITYIDMGLNTVEDYWTEVIVPDVKAFQGTPSRGALFNAAGAIWHLEPQSAVFPFLRAMDLMARRTMR